MSKLVWDETGERIYETGIDRGVLYPVVKGAYPKGYAWNGLTSVSESPSGAEASPIYADNIEYLSLISAEKFAATIEAYTYPDEWGACDGSAEVAKGVTIGQQKRKAFGLSYRSLIGNDIEDTDYGYKIHLIYNGKAAPSERSRQTVNESLEAVQFSWGVSTTPVTINTTNPNTGKVYKPTAHLEIDSTKVDSTRLKEFEDILYGKDGIYTVATGADFDTGKNYYELIDGEYVKTTDSSKETDKTYYEATVEPVDARLPMPDEVIQFFNKTN